MSRIRTFLAKILPLSLGVVGVAGTMAAYGEDYLDTVVIHPPFSERPLCSEHPEGTLKYIGDALGRDCFFEMFIEGEEGVRRSLLFKGGGSINEDWYVYGSEVLAPFNGTVADIHINPTENRLGVSGEGFASRIVIRRDDGMNVLYAHIINPLVEKGDAVLAGQPMASVGNNGMSYGPHLHIGAWKEKVPHQIIFDLRATDERDASE